MTLIGHDAAWRAWRAALTSPGMHHAWLLTGPRGVGKGSFARAAAAALVDEPGRVAPEAGADADILLLDHLPDGDDEAKKRDDGKPFKAKRSISIDQIRRLQSRLTMRPTLGSRRVVIIDPADDMERPAANALLKSLEEPPQGSFFMLVAHQPGRLPATIRSRCRVLRFGVLSDADVDAVLRRAVPDADGEARAAAVLAARGSPGAALAFVERNIAPLAALVQRLLVEGDQGFALRAALAEEVGARPDRARIAALFDLAGAALAAELAAANRERQLRIVDAHAALSGLAGQAPTYNFDTGLLVMEIGGLLASAAVPRAAATHP